MPRAQREHLILEVAGQVFARSGYHDASMDEIAELADVSKPMLYAYFNSKEGLYLAYLGRTGRELVERLERAASGGSTPLARLRSRISEFLAFVEEYRDGWRVLFREASSSGPLAQEVAALREQIAQAVRVMLEGESTVSHALSPPATDAIAHAIVGAGESLANWWLSHPEVARSQVVEWYGGLVQAAIAAALARPRAPRSPR